MHSAKVKVFRNLVKLPIERHFGLPDHVLSTIRAVDRRFAQQARSHDPIRCVHEAEVSHDVQVALARGIGQRLNLLVVFFKFLTVRVDQYRSGIGLNNVRSRVENFDAAFDESWSRQVVRGLPAKQFGARQLDASTEIPARTDVFLVAHVPDSTIAIGEFADNVPG